MDYLLRLCRRSLVIFISTTFILVGSASFASAQPVAEKKAVTPTASVEKKPTKKAKKRTVKRNTFVFNPRKLRWYAYNKHGKLLRSGRASGGANYCPDVRRACRTPVKTSYIISKRGANCRSSRYPLGRGGAPMPYCMFFSKYYAIHGSYDLPKRNASHGCIRVSPKAAKWLHKHFIRIGTKVVVKPY